MTQNLGAAAVTRKRLEVEPFGVGACGDEDAALLAPEFREPLVTPERRG